VPFVERGQHRLYCEVTDIAAPWPRQRPTLLFHDRRFPADR
jgi:hypothetical protein